jgi:hypothetical protein
VAHGELGNPLPKCRVIEQVSGGTHRVFLADVQRAERFEGDPLAYFRGQLGRLELEQAAPLDVDLLDPVLSRYFYDVMSFLAHG